MSMRALLLIPLAAVLLAACSQNPRSPQELLQRVADLNAAGEVKPIWSLFTDKARQDYRDTIETLKTTLERNPDPKNLNLLKQFNINFEELHTLPLVEIFVRQNTGWERALEGYAIVDVFPDPRDPTNTIVVWKSDATLKPQQMLCQEQDDGTWALINLRHF